MAGLTPKQRQFVIEYIIDWNATQAAIRAGYSKKTAGQIGEQNLKKLDIQTAIQDAMVKREERTEITGDRVVHELAKIAFAKITDYLEYGTELRIVDYQDGKPVYDWAMIVEAIESSKVDGAPIQEVSVSKDGTFKFKMYNKLDALNSLGKHLGVFNEGADNGNQEVTIVDDL